MKSSFVVVSLLSGLVGGMISARFIHEPIVLGNSSTAIGSADCKIKDVVCARRILLFDEAGRQVASFDSEGGARLEIINEGNKTIVLPGAIDVHTSTKDSTLIGDSELGSSKLSVSQTFKDSKTNIDVNATNVVPFVTLSTNIKGQSTSSTLRVDGSISHP